MIRLRSLCCIVLGSALLANVLLFAQEKSPGLKVGESLPGSFRPLTINKKYFLELDKKGKAILDARNRHHSLVTEFGLNPVVLVFVNEARAGKDSGLSAFLNKLELAIQADQKEGDKLLRAFVVYLSKDARGSVFEAELPALKRTTKPEQLVKETIRRQALVKDMEARAQPFKHVIVTVYPEAGPPAYRLADHKDIAIVLYNRLRVEAVYSFAAGKLRLRNSDTILGKVIAMAASQ